MAKIRKMWKRSSFEIFCVITLSVLIIITGNWFSERTVNTDSEYGHLYSEMAKKEFLTEEEVIQLKDLETEHIEDSQARRNRISGYYGSLFISMTIVSIIGFWIQYRNIVHLTGLILSPFIFISALLATNSLLQSLLWACFALFGMVLGRYLSRRKASKEFKSNG